MQTRLPLRLTVVLGLCVSGSAAAQPPPDEPPPATGQGTSHVSLVEQRGGHPIVVVDYPWRVHAEPSVEVRLVTGGQPDPSAIRPLLFVGRYLHGEVRVKVYQAEDEAAGTGAILPLTEDQLDFQILGRKNSLGKAAVCVAHRVPGSDPAPGAAAVFCLLPSWAINERLLHLDLPREDFAEAGEMYVWFLRAGRVLWEEKIDWAGYGERGRMTKHE